MLRVSDVEPLDDHRLRIAFNDGVTREVDCSFLFHGTLGAPLRDPEYFRRACVRSSPFGYNARLGSRLPVRKRTVTDPWDEFTGSIEGPPVEDIDEVVCGFAESLRAPRNWPSPGPRPTLTKASSTARFTVCR
jgi:hypothetical protein